MQVVEAMLALSILIVAITWAVTVSQRPADAPVESDDLRTLTRQAIEIMDAHDDPAEVDTVPDHLENCPDDGDIALAILDAIGDASINVYVRADGPEHWVGSAYTNNGPVSVDEPLAPGRETSVVRYLSRADICDDVAAEAVEVSLRIEVWRL